MADAIGHRDVTAVGDGVPALNDFPGAMLIDAVSRFFPRDASRWPLGKTNLRALQRRQSGRFRVPLVPANANAQAPVTRRPGAKAKIARRKIEFLVIQRSSGMCILR